MMIELARSIGEQRSTPSRSTPRPRAAGRFVRFWDTAGFLAAGNPRRDAFRGIRMSPEHGTALTAGLAQHIRSECQPRAQLSRSVYVRNLAHTACS